MKALDTLPTDYKQIFKVNLQKDKKIAMLLSIGAAIIFVAMAVIMNMYIPISTMFSNPEKLVPYIARFLTLAVGMYAYIILHELTHGIVIKMVGSSSVHYGFTGLYAYAGSDSYFNKKAYLTIALAPIVLWGIVLAALNMLVPVEWFWVVYIIQIGNISGGTGDLYVTWKFSKMPDDILVHDSGIEMEVYSAK